MPQAKGRVSKVAVTRTGVKIPGQNQTYDRISVQIKDETGKITAVQKLTKAGKDGSELVGRLVDVTFTEKEVINPDTGESFTSRSTDSKGFILLNEDGLPSFTPGQQGRKSTTSTVGSVTSNSSNTRSSGYNADGARNGMIVGKAVELAIARKETSLEGLRNAARDVIQLTSEVETNSLKEPEENIHKMVVDGKPVEDSLDPFA